MMPLEGIRVADFTSNLSGPMAAMMLADFGAEIIKIEPISGEGARSWGTARFGDREDISAIYAAFNRNKSDIAVNLKAPEGRDIALDIIRGADVVIENYKPGVMERLGLDYSTVSKINDRIVYCSISAFGQTGPLANSPGFDLLMQAYAGPLSVTGEKGRPAVRIGPSLIDVLTGANAAYGVMLGLRERDRSGKGQLVDTSLYEAAIVFMSHLIADYTGTGAPMERWGPYFPFLAPYGIFMASDREFYIGVSSDQMWERFCGRIGRSDLTGDPRFRTNLERSRNQAELYEILVPVFRQRTAREWVKIAAELGIPNSLISELSEVVEQEQALSRRAIVPVAGLPGVKTAGIPIKLSRTPGQVRTSPPTLGQDTDRILAGLGLSGSRIEELKASKVVR